MGEKRDLNKWGDNVEVKSFVFIKRVMNRALDGYFHFKKRKGDMVAGSATFFALLSFGPILLTLISLAGAMYPESGAAKDFVLSAITNNFPNLAPWIIQSIDKIVTAQLSGETGFSFINFVVLLYACMGVVGSLHFGLKTISKQDFSGGYLVEDIKSFGAGISVAAFMGGFLLLSNPNLMKKWLYTSSAVWNNIATFFIDYNIFPALAALGFFTFYYQWSTPNHIKVKESFKGATAFVATFIVGKSFYWVYHLYTKDSLSQSFGNFYTLVVAVLWIYYLMCAFFYGASVACVREQELYQGQLMVGVPVKRSKDKPQEAPTSQGESVPDNVRQMPRPQERPKRPPLPQDQTPAHKKKAS
jgi:membrane protein